MSIHHYILYLLSLLFFFHVTDATEKSLINDPQCIVTVLIIQMHCLLILFYFSNLMNFCNIQFFSYLGKNNVGLSL